VVTVKGRIPRPPLWNAIWGRFWAVVFVLAFWPVGLVALKLAMPLFTAVTVVIVAVTVVRLIVVLVTCKPGLVTWTRGTVVRAHQRRGLRCCGMHNEALTSIEHMFIVSAISTALPPETGAAGRRCHRCGYGRWAWWGRSDSVRSTL